MKNQLLLLYSVSLLTSCSYNNFTYDISPKHGPQKWQLVEMSGNRTNALPTTGSNMAWQEWYILNLDQSFTKTRVQNNVETTQSGSYTIINLSDGQYLQLSYASKNDLIGNCTGEAKELLKVVTENELTGIWSACDGPGLIYEKK